VIIRPAAPADLPTVGDLTLAAYVADGFLSATDDYAGELRAAADRAAGGELAVAVDTHGELLGTVTFALAGTALAEVSRPGEAEFRMLAVAPSARGRGVGAALALWCVERARDRACTAVAISTMTLMRSAHRIYERMGFVRAPDRDWWPSPQVQLIAYRLDLTAERFCDQCGEQAHDDAACADRRLLEPPRYCVACRRRMVVQVLPHGWSARCSEHGVRTSS